MTDATEIKLRSQLKQIGEALLPKYWDDWREVRKETVDEDLTDAQFARFSIVVAVQMAAVLAVDTYMTEDQFIALCKANYEGAHKQSPKFS